MNKFTFKTEKPTGKWKSFYPTTHYIKMNGHQVGIIGDSIRFMVVKKDINEDGNSNCPWKWITLKYKPESLELAKIWLNENYDLINKSYTLYLLEK